MITTLYRYRKVCFDENLKTNETSNVDIVCDAYNVVKETKHYYIIDFHKRTRKRVKKEGYSCFANKDKVDALKDFTKRAKSSILRNKYYIEFTELSLIKAKEALKAIS